MIVKQFILVLGLVSLFTALHGQMQVDGGPVRYGNEWINYDQEYFKIPVAEDGIYRISYQTLVDAGVPVNQLSAGNFRVFHLGEEIPLHISTPSQLTNSDFIEFYGKKNRAELDRFLFQDPDEDMLNPMYSLVNDTAAYFLTWTEGALSDQRYEVEENDLTNLPPAEEWFWDELVQVFSEQLIKIQNNVGVKKSNFRTGEGFAKKFRKKTSFSFQPNQPLLSGDSARLMIQFAANNRPHQMQISVNDLLRVNETFSGHQLKSYDLGVPLQGNNPTVDVNLAGNASNNDRYALAFAKLRYKRRFSLDNATFFTFELPYSDRKRYLEINNFKTDGKVTLYDLTRKKRFQTTTDGNQVRVAIPSSPPGTVTQNHQFILINEQQSVREVGILEKVEFVNYDKIQAEYLIISHPILYGEGPNTNPIKAYADYRSSPAGGNFSTVIINVEQLYDQFGYGVDRHFIAIRNFTHYVKQNWSNPRYVFIIGKSVENNQMRKNEEVQSYDEKLFFVPTFGNPGADNLLLSDNDSAIPVIPVGRLAAFSPNQIDIYLKKVKAFEANRNLPQTIADRYWMKRILHLGGGDPTIQGSIRNNLERIEKIIEENSFGAEVIAFYKSSTDAIEVSRAEQLFNIINEGVSIITFFGHSGANTFDFSLDSPENYENLNKYPIFISLGCFSGQIHNNFQGVSEKFVFAKDRGTIAFLASTGLGYVSSLRNLSESLYQTLGEDNYGQGIGDALHTTVDNLSGSPFFGVEELIQQFTLHGDPALVLNAHEGPDLTIDAKSVKIEPAVLDTQQDSFTINFDLVNLGRSIVDSVDILIEQEFPNGLRRTLLNTSIQGLFARSTITYRLPTQGKISVGLNQVHITVDPANEIAEYPDPTAESNNTLTRPSGESGVPVFVIDNILTAASPLPLSIVNEKNLTLKAQTSKILPTNRRYFFEIDTTAAFNSPEKRHQELEVTGNTIEWTPPLDWQDSTTYYWRVASAKTEMQPDFVWSESSFTYIAGSPDGWTQRGYWQMLDNNLSRVELQNDRSQPQVFRDERLLMRMTNKIYTEGDRPGFNYNNDGRAGSVNPWESLDAGISVIVGEPNTAVYWRNEGQQYNSIDRNNRATFSFGTTTPEERQFFMDFLTEIVPPDYFVFVFTVQTQEHSDYLPGDWALDSLIYGRNIFSVLEGEGAKLPRLLADRGAIPYAFVYQKGKGPLDETLAEDLYGEATVSMLMPRTFTSGSMTSPPIGPAERWGAVHFDLPQIPAGSNPDSIFVNLIGITEDNTEEIIAEKITSGLDLSGLDASRFPFIRLAYSAFDDTDRTMLPLYNWTVWYESLPDVSFHSGDQFFEFYADTLQRGEKLTLRVGIADLAAPSTDSINVKTLVISNESQFTIANLSDKYVLKQGPVSHSFELSTTELQGNHQLILEIISLGNEISSLNNNAVLPFFVRGDDIAPTLDVTFDGQHLMNGDIVAARPNILISLRDENEYLALSDTALFSLFITLPDGTVRKVSLRDEAISFYPSEPNKSPEARLEYRPIFDQEGLYKLAVQARDASGNKTADRDYEINFQVFLENAISNVLNYPNPFSTSTQFVYTLTGSPPTNYSIQIMTASGRIVREITMEEIGPLKVGTHRTEYAWDGYDEYGDQLANGVYLYRMIAKDEEGADYRQFTGQQTEKLTPYFRNGLGKMVILR